MLGSEGELKHVTEGMTKSLIYISTGFGLRVADTSDLDIKNTVIFRN